MGFRGCLRSKEGEILSRLVKFKLPISPQNLPTENIFFQKSSTSASTPPPPPRQGRGVDAEKTDNSYKISSVPDKTHLIPSVI